MAINLDPLGAMQLRDSRNMAGWNAFDKGLDAMGNLDTHLKDKYLTTGNGQYGLFAGFGESGGAQGGEPTGFAAFGKQPELADVHRSAQIRGLNHNQGVIEEKTQRPERDRNFGLKEEEAELKREQMNLWSNNPEFSELRRDQMWSKEALRSAENSLNVLIDNGVNENSPLMQEAKKKYEAAAGNIKRIQGEYSRLGVPRSLWDVDGEGVAVPKEEPQQPQTGQQPALRNFKDAAERQNFVNSFQINKYEDLPDAEDVSSEAEQNGISVSQEEAKKMADRIAAKWIGAQNWYRGTALHELDLKGKGIANEMAGHGLAVAEDNTQKREGANNAMVNFLKGNKPYSPANAKALATLVENFNEKNPKNGIEFLWDWGTGGNKAQYDAQIELLKQQFPNWNATSQQPPKKENKDPDQKIKGKWSHLR